MAMPARLWACAGFAATAEVALVLLRPAARLHAPPSLFNLKHACRYMLAPSLQRFEEVTLVLFRHAAQLLAFPLWFEFKRAYRRMHAFILCVL